MLVVEDDAPIRTLVAEVVRLQGHEVLEAANGAQAIELAASGHVAGVINPPAKNRRSHWLNDDVSGDSDAWLDKAEGSAPDPRAGHRGK